LLPWRDPGVNAGLRPAVRSVASMDDAGICTNCGTPGTAGARFCDACGARRSAGCPACGTRNRPEARFCAACGRQLDAGTQVGGPGGPSDPGDPAASPVAERRLVSVMFVDLVGFTTLAEGRDPEQVRELLTRYMDTASDIVRRHAGTVEKFIGDAVMAVWGAPSAHEDDAERAVRSALGIVDAVRDLETGLDARAAIMTGEAAVSLGARDQGMVAGDLVNTAARLQALAEPGTVLAGEATMRAASRAVVFQTVGERTVRGRSLPVPAWQALRVVAARGGQGRADTLEAPFVGRREELQQLTEVLHGVSRDRRPRLVSVTGVGGIGKSRLLWELEKYIDGLAEPIYWHSGRSPSYGDGMAFWALGEMVRRRAQLAEDADEPTTRERIAVALEQYVPERADRDRIGPALLALLGVEGVATTGRDALFPAWRQFFERIATLGTTVLVFEDLQWADGGLLDFIDHLLDWSRDLPILVITLARPELFDRRPDWGADRRNLTALSLQPLSDSAIQELLSGLVPGLPDDALRAIAGRADGIPLYAVETVRGLLATGRIERRGDMFVPVGDLTAISVPESLRSLIASRLDGLDPGDRSLVQDASVLGQAFSVEALAGVTGTDAAALTPRLRTLVRRDMLEVERDPASPERGQYRFVQSLIREVAYGTLARRDRRARHLAVARHFESLGDDELAGALAAHYLAARDASDAGPEADALTGQARLALAAAAQRAASLGAHDQALDQLDQALAITTDRRERAALLDRAAASASAAGRDAAAYAEAAIAIWVELGDAVAAAATRARLGRYLLDDGEVVRAGAMLEAAIGPAESAGDPAVLAETLAHLARVHMRNGDAHQAVAAADRALAIAEPLDADAVIAEALLNKASVLALVGRWRESFALGDTALRMAIEGPDRGFELRTRNNLASGLTEVDPARAAEMFVEAQSLARDLGDRGMFIWLAAATSVHLYAAGRDWDTQAEAAEAAMALPGGVAERVRLVGWDGLHRMARDEDVPGLLERLRTMAGNSQEPDVLSLMAHVLSVGHLVMGDLRAAFDAAWAGLEVPAQGQEEMLAAALRATAWDGDLERTRMVAERRASLPHRGPLSRAQRTWYAAIVAAIEGRPDTAAESFRAAIEAMWALGWRFEAACCCVDAAVLLPGHPAVRALVERTRPLLVELRARPWLERLDDALSRPVAAAAPPAQVGLPAAVVEGA